jgi:DNA-binding MurR/RpiR family transcriptional regulator
MTPASNYEELKTIITRICPDMSRQIKRIARFVLEDPNDLVLGTVATVAKSTDVQPSAIIRFANTLGYSVFFRNAADFPRKPVGAVGQLP